MKKYIFSLFVVVLALVSCSDQEDIDIAYKSRLTVSASHIFEQFKPVINQNDFSLNEEGHGVWNVNLHTFIYDEQGSLVQKAEDSYSSLVPSLNCELMLAPGKYTIVSIADFSGTYLNQNYKFWNISNESSLRDLKIEESDNIIGLPFETLGIDTQEITIDNEACPIEVDIQPVTGLLEVIMWDDDLAEQGENGFSFYAPYIRDLSIYASQLKQIVKFNGTTPSYEYNTQTTTYMVQTHSPLLQFDKRGAKQVLGYRAFLPIQERDFFWELNCVEGCGQYLFSDGKDFQTSEKTIPVTIESGKQYVMDFVLDALHLYVADYDPSKSMFERLEGYLDSNNKEAIKQIFERKYDQIIGSTRDFVYASFGDKPYSDDDHMIIYMGENQHILSTGIVFDETTGLVKAINIIMSLNDKMTPLITEYLNENYTVYEKGTTSTNKAYINNENFSDATVGVVWDISQKMLSYVTLN